MLFRVLGPLEVEVGTVPIVPPGAHGRAVLTALLLRPNFVVPAHRLAEAVWGEEQPEKAANALHQIVARLRKALGPAGETIVTRPPGYLLVATDSSIDAGRFETLSQAARTRARDDPGAGAAGLDEALGLWRGPAYGEFADGFARAAATRLEQLRLAALEERAALMLAAGRTSEAVASASDLVAQHPLRERPVEVLMRGLHAAGSTGEALEAYRRHREVVARELGLDPGPVLRELEARILRGETDLPRHGSVEVPAAAPVRVRPRTPDLPWRPSAILGRDDELAAVLEALRARRLVTLVGPGGVGKTRLALEVAHRLKEHGRQVWWGDLTTVSPERIVDALAGAAGADIPRTGDPAAALCAALGAHRGVLCLDNAEHLLGSLAPVVERLVDAAPNLVVLATSRERLALDAESVRVLAPLPLPTDADRANPAVRLFIERMAGGELDALSEDDIGVVAHLCRRLDGLPLAIELAAARAGALGVHDLADRLGQRLDVLAGGRRTADARHRTLRTVVDWSHRLLTADEALLFYRLATFPGPFSLGQVESVCADERLPARVMAALVARLVEQSLVQAARGRFWLLETLRDYAGEQLRAEGEAERLRDRHAHDTADRLAVLDRRLWTPDEAAAVAALGDLVVDLHAAWQYAVAGDSALAVRLAADVYDFAYIRQRLDLLAWGLHVASTGADAPGLPRALAAASAAAWAGGRLEEAKQHAARAIAVAGVDEPSAARAVTQQGNVAMFENRLDDAMAAFRTAAKLHRIGREEVRGLADDVSVVQALVYTGRTEESRNRMRSLVDLARRTGNPSCTSWALYIAGEAAAGSDYGAARACYAEAIEYGTRSEARLFVMLARSSAIALAAHRGPPDTALEQFDELVDQWEQLGNELAQWWVLRYLVLLLDRVGAVRDAAVLAGAVIAASDRSPSFGPVSAPMEDTVARVRDRLGRCATEEALAEGEALSHADAVGHARRAIAAARRDGGRRPARQP